VRAEVVEVRGEEDEVAIAWDGGDTADGDGTEASGGVVREGCVGGRVSLYYLAGEVTEEVDDQ